MVGFHQDKSEIDFGPANRGVREDRDFLEALLQTTNALVVVLDADGRIVLFNRACEILAGRRLAEIEGKPFAEVLLSPEERDDFHSLLSEHSAGLGASRRGSHWIDVAGRRHSIDCSLATLVHAGERFVVCTGIDVSEQSENEKQQSLMLKRLEGIFFLQDLLLLPAAMEEHFQMIVDTAVELLDIETCSLWLLRPGDLCDTACLHANAAEADHRCGNRDRCFHLIANSGICNAFDDRGRRVPQTCPAFAKIAGDGVDQFSAGAADEDLFDDIYRPACCLDVDLRGCKLLNLRGDTAGVLAITTKHPLSTDDITFLGNLAKKATKVILDHDTEEALRQSQKLEAVGQLAGGIAHEFNNLMQVIEGYTRYAIEGLDTTEDRYRDLEQVLEASERASTLTRQLLGFARREAISPKSVDANRIVCDLFNLLRPTLGKLITAKYFLADDAGTVYADAVDLQQSLLNLCLNARDAMPCGGILTVATERAVLSGPFPDSPFDIQPGSYVAFSVSDTGSGISRDVRQRMFEPFFTTKKVGSGTGLGLSMVYGMVRQHKGSIEVESELDRGTKITLYLPSGEPLIPELNGGDRRQGIDVGAAEQSAADVAMAEVIASLG